MTVQFDRSLKDDKPQLPDKTPPTPNTPSPPPRVPSRTSPLQWFYDLSVGRKQFLGLFLSEAISVIGIASVGALLIVSGGRAQLREQAKSELAAMEVNYNIKIDQMGFGFRGQSDNAAIIAAAQAAATEEGLDTDDRNRVREILENEIQARNIEYATLVGTDKTIIASANANRVGQTFDPNGLVSRVLSDREQIKTNAIVTWDELQQESPPLPEGFTDSDALIRYTVTPVRDGQTLVGVLVSGDIVNGKLPIVAKTLEEFETGYSGVYLYSGAEEAEEAFALTTSLEKETEESEGETNADIVPASLLEAAIAAPEETVAERISQGYDTYTAAARAVTDTDGDPVAVLVRGTPETALNELLGTSLQLQLLVAVLAVVVNVILGRLLGRTIVNPIRSLEKTTDEFARGNRQARAQVWAKDEIGQLAGTFNAMADSITREERRQRDDTDRERIITQVTTRIRESLDRDRIFEITVNSTREVLNADRTLIYLFDEDWQGTIVAESVLEEWPEALGARIADPCFAQNYAEKYQQGRIHATNDILNADLTECHRNQLAPFSVRANLVAPILVNEKLLGLLVSHQCSGPRDWLPGDISIARAVAVQLGLALEQAELFASREQAREAAEAATKEQRQQKEAIQMQLINLLSEIDGAARGDLTVRADVTAGDIGTVADFFNSIVESLRQIVTQVKTSASQVNASLGENEGAIRQLTEDALQQARETTRTLDSVEQMTASIRSVATSARQAAEVARTASTTAQSGGEAMDRTVENILSLRETVAETAKKVKRLGESSQQISRVVSLINQIALQTNLLAINAGIEAARAGEEGQGFAVVAEEVGELAERSAGATKEIERIVENIQLETTQVVEAMERSTAQVVEGTHLVEDTKQSLGQIVEVSQQIDELVQSISTATVSQAETSEAVSSLMQEIARVSEQTSDSSRQVSDSLRDTVEIAEQLQASMETFKVDSQS
ncbi:MAG: methyl-accepting chemotaxis protein [Cyanobacteriota bacterium]|nr:methyl-accepting chemotaxis protein [Cyanobacteriota bacterium]